MRQRYIPSYLVGVPSATLSQWLSDAQQAYHDLQTGVKGETYSYTQGDGSKAVTYTRADLTQLNRYIQDLATALDLMPRRRAIRPIF